MEDLQVQAQALQARWEEGRDLDLPRPEAGRLQRRWQGTWQAVQERIRLAHRLAERRELDLLEGRAELCRELEQQAEMEAAPAAADAAAWQGRWAALPSLADAATAQGIGRRFQSALDALADPQAAAAWRRRLPEQAEQRRRLCLQLEVLTGVDSPPEAVQERLLFQVSRLRERLGQGEADPLDAAPALERAWYLAGPAPTAEMPALEARFERARAALLQGQGAAGRETAAESA
jgi:hypothetical protein